VTCQHALEHFDDYLDDNLGRGSRWRVRLHLWICRNCRRYLSSYRTTISLVHKVCGDADDAEVPEALVSAILSARRG
jgi:predicted anti-sigma-YlaC factor YlaD